MIGLWLVSQEVRTGSADKVVGLAGHQCFADFAGACFTLLDIIVYELMSIVFHVYPFYLSTMTWTLRPP